MGRIKKKKDFMKQYYYFLIYTIIFFNLIINDTLSKICVGLTVREMSSVNNFLRNNMPSNWRKNFTPFVCLELCKRRCRARARLLSLCMITCVRFFMILM